MFSQNCTKRTSVRADYDDGCVLYYYIQLWTRAIIRVIRLGPSSPVSGPVPAATVSPPLIIRSPPPPHPPPPPSPPQPRRFNIDKLNIE